MCQYQFFSLSKAAVEGRLRPEINVCSLDGVEEQLSHASSFHVDKVRLEKSFWSPKSLSTYIYLPAIGELQQTHGPIELKQPGNVPGFPQRIISLAAHQAYKLGL